MSGLVCQGSDTANTTATAFSLSPSLPPSLPASLPPLSLPPVREAKDVPGDTEQWAAPLVLWHSSSRQAIQARWV